MVLVQLFFRSLFDNLYIFPPFTLASNKVEGCFFAPTSYLAVSQPGLVGVNRLTSALPPTKTRFLLNKEAKDTYKFYCTHLFNNTRQLLLVHLNCGLQFDRLTITSTGCKTHQGVVHKGQIRFNLYAQDLNFVMF